MGFRALGIGVYRGGPFDQNKAREYVDIQSYEAC